MSQPRVWTLPFKSNDTAPHGNPQWNFDIHSLTLRDSKANPVSNDTSSSNLFRLKSINDMVPTVLHLRSETKPLEHRSALTPITVKALSKAGFTVNVERSAVRIFNDTEFEDAGATLVPTGSWPDVPQNHIIIGLKELPGTDTFPLKHIHVQFAHCYKEQDGWQQVLGRFHSGGGTLLDLEFLTETGKRNGRRVAAFGYHAGFVGAALAVEAWSWQVLHGREARMPGVKPYAHEEELLRHISRCLKEGEVKTQGTPRALVMGESFHSATPVTLILMPCIRSSWTVRSGSG